MFRKKFFESVGGFDTKLHTSADWDFFRRIANQSHLEFLSQASVYYRRHNNNMSLQSLKMYYADNEIAIAKLFTDVDYPQNSLTKPFMLLYVWVRFQLGAASAHFKNREFKLSFSRLLRILSFPK
jgi:GT2 family glycosyltransferase